LDTEPYKVWLGQTTDGRKRLIILFRIELQSADFKKTDEAEEVQYVTKDEFVNLNLVPQLNPLKEMINELDKAV
jgi:hypothetical protein